MFCLEKERERKREREREKEREREGGGEWREREGGVEGEIGSERDNYRRIKIAN